MANGTEAGRVMVAGRMMSDGTIVRTGESPGVAKCSARLSAGRFRLVLGGLFGAVLLSGCETRQTVDTQMYITELETEVMQLQGDLDAAYQEIFRISQLLTTQVADLEASMGDVNLRVLDLPTAIDPTTAVREVEAVVAVAQRRVTEVKATTRTLAEYLE